MTREGSYIELPEWIGRKKDAINSRNEKDEECFKWEVIAALHHEEISSRPERTAKLQYYEDQSNWSGLRFPVEISKIGNFDKNNMNIAVNVLFRSKG